MRRGFTIHCPGCNQPIEVLLSVNHGPRWGNTHVTLDRPINHICQEDPMPVHADRDHSEQPTAQTPQNGPETALSREQGTSGQSGEGEALRGAENGEQRCCGHVRCPGGSLCCCQDEEAGR